MRVSDVAAGALLTLDGTPVQTVRQLDTPGRAHVSFTRTTAVAGSGAVSAVTLQGLKAGSGALAVESLVIGRVAGTEQPAPPAPARVVVAP